MTLSDLVSDPAVFEVPYNVVTWKDGKTIFLYSNFTSDDIPETLASQTIRHITMQEGYLEIEI